MNLNNFAPWSAPTTEPLTQDGVAVARPDREYDLNGEYVAFDELLLTGHINGEHLLDYRGGKLRILQVMEQIGQLVDNRGARGPVLRGVLAKVERRP